MGMKDDLIERQQAERDAKIAEHLGLTPDEYEEAGGRLEEDRGNDDMLYGYTVYFDDDAPKETLEKAGAIKNGYATLPPNFFNGEPEE